MFYIVPIFIIIIFSVTIGLHIFKTLKNKENGQKIAGQIIFIIGMILFVVSFFINFFNIMGGNVSFGSISLPFVGMLLMFVGVFISKISSKTSSSNTKKQVKLDDNGNYVFGDEDEDK